MIKIARLNYVSDLSYTCIIKWKLIKYLHCKVPTLYYTYSPALTYDFEMDSYQ